MKICLPTLFLLMTVSVFAFENQHMKMSAPKGWKENPNLFGASVIFESSLTSKKAPLTLYVNTFPADLRKKDIHSFIINDLKKEFATNNFKVLTKNIIKTKKTPIHFVEGSLTEKGNLEYLFVAIAAAKEKYHYYMFQAKKDRYMEEIDRIKMAVSTTFFK